MYTRSYKQDGSPAIPESYSGVAFREPEVEPIPEDAPKSVARSADIRFTSPEPPDPKLTAAAAEPIPEEKAVEAGGLFSSISEKLPFGGIFSGLSGINLSKLGLPKIGTEELLIIGLAIFLFLSRDGDKECAVLMLLLLLVH